MQCHPERAGGSDISVYDVGQQDKLRSSAEKRGPVTGSKTARLRSRVGTGLWISYLCKELGQGESGWGGCFLGHFYS